MTPAHRRALIAAPPRPLAELVLALARRSGTPLVLTNGWALLRRWLWSTVTLGVFAVVGLGGCAAVFWALLTMLLSGLAVMPVEAARLLAVGLSSALACAAVATLVGRDLRAAARLPSARLRVGEARGGSVAALALEAVRALVGRLQGSARARFDMDASGWTLELPELVVELDRAAEALRLTVRVPGRVLLERALGDDPRQEIVAALGALREVVATRPPCERPGSSRSLVLCDVPSRGSEAGLEACWRLEVARPVPDVVPALLRGVWRCAAVRAVALAVASLPPVVLAGALGIVLASLPVSVAFGALPLAVSAVVLVALPGRALCCALARPLVLIEPAVRRRVLVADAGRLALSDGVGGELIDLREPFAVTLTREQHGGALGIELRQAPAVLALRVAAQDNDTLASLVPFAARGGAVEVDAAAVVERLWPTIAAYAELHGRPLALTPVLGASARDRTH